MFGKIRGVDLAVLAILPMLFLVGFLSDDVFALHKGSVSDGHPSLDYYEYPPTLNWNTGTLDIVFDMDVSSSIDLSKVWIMYNDNENRISMVGANAHSHEDGRHFTIKLSIELLEQIWNIELDKIYIRGGAVHSADYMENRHVMYVITEVGRPSTPPTSIVAPNGYPASGLPTILGTLQVGTVLTADTSDISDPDLLGPLQYQWYAGDSAIKYATGSSYIPSADDQGKTIKLRVYFTDMAGNAESMVSTTTAAVKAPHDETAPHITQADVSAEATGQQTSMTLSLPTVSDNRDAAADITIATNATGIVTEVTKPVNAEFPVGDTIVQWTATDTAGNVATANQMVTITDTTKPTITLTGTDIHLTVGQQYSEPGATCTDIADPTPALTTDSSAVDTSTPGEYSVMYSCSDPSGNAADSVTRTVQVSLPLDEITSQVNTKQTNLFNSTEAISLTHIMDDKRQKFKDGMTIQSFTPRFKGTSSGYDSIVLSVTDSYGHSTTISGKKSTGPNGGFQRGKTMLHDDTYMIYANGLYLGKFTIDYNKDGNVDITKTAVQNLALTTVGNTITASWDKLGENSKYKVRVYELDSFAQRIVKIINGTSVTIDGLKSNTEYTVEVFVKYKKYTVSSDTIQTGS